MAEIETVRRAIRDDECDLLGHLNVAGYIALASDGGFALMRAFGLDESQIVAGRRQAFAVVQAEATYRAELRPGQDVHVRSGLLEIGSMSAKFRHRILAGEKAVFEAVFTCALMDLESRRARMIDDALRDAMMPFLIAADETMGHTAARRTKD